MTAVKSLVVVFLYTRLYTCDRVPVPSSGFVLQRRSLNLAATQTGQLSISSRISGNSWQPTPRPMETARHALAALKAPDGMQQLFVCCRGSNTKRTDLLTRRRALAGRVRREKVYYRRRDATRPHSAQLSPGLKTFSICLAAIVRRSRK